MPPRFTSGPLIADLSRRLERQEERRNDLLAWLVGAGRVDATQLPLTATDVKQLFCDAVFFFPQPGCLVETQHLEKL